MDLRRILSIIGFSFLTSCATMRTEEIDKPLIHDKLISLKRYEDVLSIGHDTDGDNYEDLAECYRAIAKNEEEKALYLELIEVYDDRDKDHFFEKDELIWKEGDAISKEMLKRQTLFFKVFENEGFVTIGYDTDEDKIEDSRGFYEPVGVDETAHITLQKICSYEDKNRNRLFEEDERIEKDIENLENPSTINISI